MSSNALTTADGSTERRFLQMARRRAGCACLVGLAVPAAPACSSDREPARPISLRIEGPGQVNPPRQERFQALEAWSDGTYTLTLGGGTCQTSMPPALRQRTYTVTVVQNGLMLDVATVNAGGFVGRIFNPEARFSLDGFRSLFRAGPILKRAAALREPRFARRPFRRAARAEHVASPTLVEVLPDGKSLSIDGMAVTTTASSGFSGTFGGSLTLSDSSGKELDACCSPGHVFSLVRQ